MWKRAARWAFSLALLALVGRQLQAGVAALGPQTWHPDPWWLALAFGLLALATAGGAEGWRRWVQAAGGQLSYADAFRTLYAANAAKYLPGPAWQLVSRVVLAERAGVPVGVATLAMVMDMVANLGGAIVVALATTGGRALAPGLVVLAIGLHPRVLGWGLHLGGRLLRREVSQPTYGYGTALALVIFYAGVWALLGAGAAALARALGPVADPYATAGAMATAWVAGTLAPIAPAGLGVRELSFTLLAGPLYPPGFAAALAIALRLWLVTGDLLTLALALGSRRTSAPPGIKM